MAQECYNSQVGWNLTIGTPLDVFPNEMGSNSGGYQRDHAETE